MTTKLDEYAKKRHFERTPEPRGKRSAATESPIFVIQKHQASTLHYDFRLQSGDVLKSWAVPKGLSTDPNEKRLALPTEDHPLEYAQFEGDIPADEYGGGTVLVWDTGPYENVTQDKDSGDTVPLEKAIQQGHAVVRLHGEKLRGGYALTRIDAGDEEKWLIVKTDDDEADARRNPVSTEPQSVLSGRTLEEIAADSSPGKARKKQ